MNVLRTPDERFTDLPGYPWEPRYVDVDGVRMHYVEDGPASGPPVLLLHGEPTWSYLYRTMIPVLAAAGFRTIAPDLIGFGRSDKFGDQDAYTYARHLGWVNRFLDSLDLQDIVLFGQDWGGLLGLRIAAEQEDRFTRIVAANTMLPTGDRSPGEGFERWKRYSQETEHFHVGGIVKGGCSTELAPEVIAAYDAPFPDDSYKAAARRFPMLVPVTPDDPESEPNRQAWKVLERWEKPFLCLFGDRDVVLGNADKVLLKLIPGTKGQPHQRFPAGHFIQEDVGEELAAAMVRWMS